MKALQQSNTQETKMEDQDKQNQLELKKRLKKKEQEKRDKSKQSAEVKIDDGTGDNKIGFDQWWMSVKRERKMQPWLKEILWADFKARGLSSKEPKEQFDWALKQFGY